MERHPLYGSDVIVDLMHLFGIEYAAFNPGASFRGLHDSIVNYGGNKLPEAIICCHEEISVAIAHGYAKAAQKPMAAIVHNVVGLQHASMAIYNAWCDRVPMMVLGGTGPMDATARRPWIDWVHTALVQGNLVRDFVKWDDQPHNLASVPESFARGYQLTTAEPQAPVYICYDTTIQEEPVHETPALPLPEKVKVQGTTCPSPLDVQNIAAWLMEAKHPVIIADYFGRNPEAVPHLVRLVEYCGAAFLDKGGRMNFPNEHPQDLTGAEAEMLAQADCVLALDVHDLYGALHPGPQGHGSQTDILSPGARVIHVTLMPHLVRSWASDFERLQPTDLTVLADSHETVIQLVKECQRLVEQEKSRAAEQRMQRRRKLSDRHHQLRDAWQLDIKLRSNGSSLTPAILASVIGSVIKDHDWALVNGKLRGWPRKLWGWKKTACYLGGDAGGGVGYGMGASIGATLAWKNTERLCINIQSDGDLLYTPSALWTAAHHQIPLLTVMYNNQSYFNSEQHALHMAKSRNRPEENSGIGTQIRNPEISFVQIAQGMGVQALGPCRDADELDEATREAVRIVTEERRPVLVDTVVRDD